MADRDPAPLASSPNMMRRPAAAGLAIVSTLLGLLVLGWAVLFVTRGRFLRPTFEHLMGGLLDRQVRVGGAFEFYFAPFSLHVRADALRVANPDYTSRPDLLSADHLEGEIAPLSLLWGRWRFHWLELSNAAGDLEWSPDHRGNSWTFGDPNKHGKPFIFPIIDRATVAGTTIRYRDTKLRLLADIALQTIRSTDARIAGDVRFTGKGVVRGTPFTTTGALLSPNATIGRGKNQLTMAADAAGNHLTLDGTLPSLAEIERVPLAIIARGHDLSELLAIIGIATPRTRAYQLRAQLVKDGQRYAFTHMTGSFGASDLAGRFTILDVEPRIRVDATLATRSLDVYDAAPFIGYNPDLVATQGFAAASGQAQATPRLLPDTPLRAEVLQNFDADLRYTVEVLRSRNVPLSDIDLTLSLQDRLLKLSPLTFTMARGHVASDTVLNARRRPAHVDTDIRIAPTPLGRLLAGWGVAEAGTSGTVKGRIELHGDGDSMHRALSTATGRIAFVLPQGSFWTRNIQLSELDLGTFAQKMFQHELKEPVAINCGLVAFTVRNGIGAADPILIDTAKNVMIGRGGFSFKDESLDLAFRADGKKFSLFSGQSPVGINGYFAKPGIDAISPQLLGRAGLGLGLALIAAPPAAILAFVDIGDAKAAACGPVLGGATAAAQRTTKGQPRDDVGHGTTAKEEDGKASAGEKKTQRKKFLGIF